MSSSGPGSSLTFLTPAGSLEVPPQCPLVELNFREDSST